MTKDRTKIRFLAYCPDAYMIIFEGEALKLVIHLFYLTLYFVLPLYPQDKDMLAKA